MKLSDADKETVTTRLAQAQASFDEVTALLESDADTSVLIAKLNEASRLLDRASFALMVSSLQGNTTASEPERAENIKHLEQLFLHLD